jgi:hypothetical protein
MDPSAAGDFMRHRTSRTIALTFAAIAVVMTSACSSSSTRSDHDAGPTSIPTAQQPSPKAARTGASASPFVKPSFSASPLPGGILPVAVARTPTPPLRALAPGFSLSAFLQHERTTWGIDTTVQSQVGSTPSPDDSTVLTGSVNRAGDLLRVLVGLNERHQVTMIQCVFGMVHNAVADRFIDDCARTALPGVNTTAVVDFVDHARTEIANANKKLTLPNAYVTPSTQFGNDRYIFTSEPTTDSLSILGTDAT